MIPRFLNFRLANNYLSEIFPYLCASSIKFTTGGQKKSNVRVLRKDI